MYNRPLKTTVSTVSTVLPVLFIILAYSGALSAIASPADHFLSNRRLLIWNWDSPGDLSFLSGEKTAVIRYDGTFYLRGEDVFFRPYQKKLTVPGSTPIIPAYRLEVREGLDPQKSSASYVASTIAKRYAEYFPGAGEIQIDFDATVSQRPFYKSLLVTLRKTLEPSTKIGVTALASWCLDDRWLSRSLVDNVVVMLFSMGPGRQTTRQKLTTNRLSAGDNIPITIGISASESDTLAVLGQTDILANAASICVFNSLPWTASRYQKIKTYLRLDNR